MESLLVESYAVRDRCLTTTKSQASPGEGVQNGLNQIYSQAVVRWTVLPMNGLTGVELGDNGLDWADSQMLSAYNAEMNSVISAFRDWKHDADPDAYYLFVVPKFSEGSVEGFMPRSRRFGFVTLNQLDARLVAHEVGHGAFNLRHTFPEAPQGSTDNLMDYPPTGGQAFSYTALLKAQWDLIYNPEATTGLFDGMEDGASYFSTDGNDCNPYLAYKLRNSYKADTIFYASGEDVHLIQTKNKYSFFIYKKGKHNFPSIGDRVVEEPIDTIKWSLNGASPVTIKTLDIKPENYVVGTNVDLEVNIPEQTADLIEGTKIWHLPVKNYDLKLNLTFSNSINCEFLRSQNYKGEYGFDNDFTTCDKCYKSYKLNAIKYDIPWVSLSQNSPANMNILIKVDPDQFKALKKSGDFIKVYGEGCMLNGVPDSIEIPISELKEGENRFAIKVNSTRETSNDFEVYDSLYAKMNGEIIGKAYFFCKGAINFCKGNLHIVRVFTDATHKFDFQINSAMIQNYFNNNAYNQAFISWTVKQEADIEISWANDSTLLKQMLDLVYTQNWNGNPKFDYSQIIYDLKKGIKRSYNSDIVQQFLSNFQRLNDPPTYYNYVEGNNHVLYISDIDGDSGGIGTVGGKVSVIFKPCLNDYSAYVHEVGHNLKLNHAFEVGNEPTQRGVPEGVGNNFMNYYNAGLMFWKTDWKTLNDSTK